MNTKNNDLTEKDRLETRKFLRVIDGSLKSEIAKLGRPSSLIGNAPDLRRQWFGIELMLLAPFILMLFIILPNDSNRWLIFGFAWLSLFVGAWQVDLSRK